MQWDGPFIVTPFIVIFHLWYAHDQEHAFSGPGVNISLNYQANHGIQTCYPCCFWYIQWYQHRPQTAQVNQPNQKTIMKTWRRHVQCGPYTESQVRAQPSPARPPEPNPRPTQPSGQIPRPSAPSTAKSAPNTEQRAHQSQTHAQPSPAAKSHAGPVRPAQPNPRPTQHSAPTSVSSLLVSKIEPHR